MSVNVKALETHCTIYIIGISSCSDC